MMGGEAMIGLNQVAALADGPQCRGQAGHARQQREDVGGGGGAAGSPIYLFSTTPTPSYSSISACLNTAACIALCTRQVRGGISDKDDTHHVYMLGFHHPMLMCSSLHPETQLCRLLMMVTS